MKLFFLFFLFFSQDTLQTIEDTSIVLQKDTFKITQQKLYTAKDTNNIPQEKKSLIAPINKSTSLIPLIEPKEKEAEQVFVSLLTIHDSISQYYPMVNYFETILSKKYEISQKRDFTEENWLFYFLFLLLLIFAYIRYNFYKDLLEIYRAFVNLNIARQLQRVQEQTLPVSHLLLNILFLISGGIYFFMVLQHFKLFFNETNSSFLWIVISGILLVIYVLKLFSLKVISSLFNLQDDVDFYIFNISLFSKIESHVFLISSILLAFSSGWIFLATVYVSLTLLAIIFVYRYLRGMIIAKDYFIGNKFHFFIYLCTLEIAPFFILIRILEKWV